MANVNTDNINTRTDINRLPGFDRSFNGPIHYFQRLFLIPFTMALGNITMDNVSLLDTWNAVDPGAPGVAGNAAQVNQRNARTTRRLCSSAKSPAMATNAPDIRGRTCS